MNDYGVVNRTQIYELIHFIRGEKVMLDANLAVIYGYTTKAFNQQVKNNIHKFDGDFRFQLTKDEYEEILKTKNLIEKYNPSDGFTNDSSNKQILKSKILTSSWGGTRKLPYAFTEQGVYMLMTVLKGELATYQSKALIRAFKEMKDFLIDNRNLLGNQELFHFSLQTLRNTSDIAEIRNSMVTKADLTEVIHNFTDTKKPREYLILNGESVEGDIAYNMIYQEAKQTIFVIDNYIGLKTLVLLKNTNTKITIFSDNIGRGLHQKEYDDFCKQYPNVEINFLKTCGIYHDRYIVLDYDTNTERIYHCGASSKDAGNKVTTIVEVTDCSVYHPIVDTLMKNPKLDLR